MSSLKIFKKLSIPVCLFYILHDDIVDDPINQGLEVLLLETGRKLRLQMHDKIINKTQTNTNYSNQQNTKQ